MVIILITYTRPPKVKTHPTPRDKRDDLISKKFKHFFENQWHPNYCYSPSDFIKIFGVTRHLARYYLMDMVYEKKLFRVKYGNKTYYALRKDYIMNRFKEYIWIGVEVL